MHARARLRGTGALAVIVVTGALLSACSGSGGSGPSVATSPAASTRPTPVAASAVPAEPSAGCQGASVRKGPPPPAPDLRQTLVAAGTSGWYFQHVPPGYNGSAPMPLIVDMHGYGESAELHTKISALGSYGDTHGFVTVTPQTAGAVPRWDTDLQGKDIAWIGGLLDQVERGLCIDERRVYATGYSNGAFMSSAVACAYAGRVAAVAPVAGIRLITGCAPSRPVPVIAFHGTADNFVPFDGSVGSAAKNLPAPDGSGKTLGQISGALAKGPSVPEITAGWAKRNGCSTTPSEQTVASDVTLVSFACPAGAQVELYRVTQGGHAWPGSVVGKSIESVVGKVTMSIDADALMWAFFQAHPLRS